MITRTGNGVTMKLRAECYWGEWCDVGIIQEWTHPQRDIATQYIEMDIAEAEALIVELQAAIVRAKELDAGYAAAMSAPPGPSDGTEHLF